MSSSRCPPGFDPVENGLRCSDKNECEMTGGGMCSNGVCVNVDGGWVHSQAAAAARRVAY